MDCVAILLKIHNQYEGERIQLCEGMPDSSYQTEWVRFDSIKITKSRVHKRRTLLVNALHGILHIFKTVREIGICYTCWWYSLCNFQYRHQYEKNARITLNVEIIRTCIFFYLFMLCLNTTTSMIYTNAFFFRFD